MAEPWEKYQQQKQDAQNRSHEAAAAAAKDPVADIPGANIPYLGPVLRGLGGFVQGEMDPFEGAAGLAGVDAGKGLRSLDPKGYDQLQAVSATPAGRVGRVAGNILNPAWEAARVLQLAGRYGPPAVRAIGHLFGNAAAGAGAGAVMPGEDRGKSAAEGAGVGAVLGVPGAAARAVGFPGIHAALRELESSNPFFKSVFDVARSVSMPDFNRTFYRYILEPLGRRGRMPATAERTSMASVERQVGAALDDATAGMTFDGAATGQNGNLSISNLMLQRRQSATNLATTGNAAPAYEQVLRETWDGPLAVSNGKLTSDQLQKTVSNLRSRIDAIPQDSEANRSLRRELEVFRQSIFDNAVATPEQRAAYANAREAWRRFTVARESSPPTHSGRFTPDDVMREMDQRQPLATPSRRGRDQEMVNAGQGALLLPGRAAANVLSRRPSVWSRTAPSVAPGTAAGLTGEREMENK